MSSAEIFTQHAKHAYEYWYCRIKAYIVGIHYNLFIKMILMSTGSKCYHGHNVYVYDFL